MEVLVSKFWEWFSGKYFEESGQGLEFHSQKGKQWWIFLSESTSPYITWFGKTLTENRHQMSPLKKNPLHEKIGTVHTASALM